MTNDEKKAVRAVMESATNSRIAVSIDGKECYRYQNNPLAHRGRAVRAPVAGRVVWHASPGPVADGTHLADVLAGGEAHAVNAEKAGRLGRPFAPNDMWVDYEGALAVLRDPD